MRAKRQHLPEATAAAYGAAAQRRILATPQWAEARAVLLYVACRGETPTDLLLERAWAEGKAVYLPRCLPEAGHGAMELACVRCREDLVPGLYSIPEPDPATCALEPEAAPETAVIPGVAFDRHGLRLGQGCGYYDRLLVQGRFAHTTAFGLAYSFQVVKALPADPWDRPVHAVATEESLVWSP